MDKYGFYIGEILTAAVAIAVVLLGGNVLPFMAGFGTVAVMFLVLRILSERRASARRQSMERFLSND